MLDGREMCGIEDKAVSTSDDPIMIFNANNDGFCHEGMQWNIVTVEKLITTLINTKMIALRTMESIESFDYYDSSSSSSYSYRAGKEKELSNKRSSHDHRHHSSHHHHHHQCSKQIKREKQYEQRSSISKVQKWSDDLDMETSFDKYQDEEIYQERSPSQKIKPSKDGSTLVEIEPKTPSKKRKRKKRKKRLGKKVSRVDPEDLPKRARWTIIITSGLLILTCMFLVGVTLRMAPVIDEMVRNKNEELMNSLNRETNPAYYSSIGWGGYHNPSEINKKKYEYET